MTDSPLIYSPAQASAHLGVSASTLRRMAATYEAAFEPLPRDDANGRIYTKEVVATLRRAQDLREAGAASLEAALLMLASGDDAALDEASGRLSTQALTHLSERQGQALPARNEREDASTELLQEMRALTEVLTDLSGQLQVHNERLERLEREPKWWQLEFWEALLKARRGA